MKIEFNITIPRGKIRCDKKKYCILLISDGWDFQINLYDLFLKSEIVCPDGMFLILNSFDRNTILFCKKILYFNNNTRHYRR